MEIKGNNDFSRVGIIDLDGTLSRVNTFTRFVKMMFARYPRLWLPLGRTVAERKLRLISHAEAKRRIMRLYADVGNKRFIEDYLDRLIPLLRREIVKELPLYSTTVLATAAPEAYAQPLGRRLGFDKVVATPAEGPECRGEEKVRRLREEGVTFHHYTVVYTDHCDDLPLLCANKMGTNLIVNPDRNTLATLQCESEGRGLNWEILRDAPEYDK